MTMQTEKQVPTLLTIRQAAKLGIFTETALRRLKAEKRLPGVQVGNRFLVNVDQLIERVEGGELV